MRSAKGLHDAKGSIRPHHLQTLAGIGVASIAAATKRIVTVVGGALKPAKAVTVVLRHVRKNETVGGGVVNRSPCGLVAHLVSLLLHCVEG